MHSQRAGWAATFAPAVEPAFMPDGIAQCIWDEFAGFGELTRSPSECRAEADQRKEARWKRESSALYSPSRVRSR